jgi:multiple sugar transport system permease protein/putative aldouronate transport system permease protein
MVNTAEKKKSPIKHTMEDKFFYSIVGIILGVKFLVILYPLIYVVASSFSSPHAVSTGRVYLWPVDFSLAGYRAVFANEMVGIGYVNSVINTTFGTMINIVITILAAYPLACTRLPGRRIFMFMFTFTMLFSGGMIPNYILVRSLGMLNTRWALLIPNALGIFNMIITRTFIQNSIPGELQEAAEIDGASDIQYLLHCVLPLAKPVIAVITLFYAVGHWNSFFNAFLYISTRRLFPLQIVLRDILISHTIDPSVMMDETLMAARLGMAELLRYSLIIVSSLPVMMIYPFIQKYFIQGVMIGSLKG